MKNIFVTLAAIFILGNLSGQEIIFNDGKYFNADGKLFSGIYKEYDANNSLVAENNIVLGELDGNSFFYFPSGAKKEQRAYRKGKKDGVWINWNEKGVKTAEARFVDGKKDGYWYIWDDTGTKRYEMFYVAGEKKGTWMIWDEKGKLITEQKYD